MSRQKKIFDFSNNLFWLILALIVILSTPVFRNQFYSSDKLTEWLNRFDTTIISKPDTSLRPTSDKNNLILVSWKWKDFENRNQAVKFSILKTDLEKARNYRINYASNLFFSPGNLYMDFVKVSMPVIDSFTSALRLGIQQKNIRNNIEVLNYVVSAIQFPEYTKITSTNECPCNDMGRDWVNDCTPRQDGKGCCNNVVPMAVYTPTEFVYQKTGDCDTKALIAYAILKKMGYDVAVIVGDTDGGAHAMLAVANIRPIVYSKYVKQGSKIYFPWEVTSRDNSFVLGNTGMWNTWKNWSVVIN
jgi:hypothetical protein